MSKEKYIYIFKDRPYPPNIMYLVKQGTVRDFTKIFPDNKITKAFGRWQDARSAYFFLADEISSTMDDLFQRSKKSPDFLYDIFKEAYNRAKELRIFTENFLKTDLNNLTKDELIDLCKNFDDKFIYFYQYGTVPTLMGYADQTPIYKDMENTLRHKTKDDPSKFADYLLKLTSPLGKMKAQNLDIAALEIAKLAKAKNLSTREEISKEFKKEIESLHDEYSYLSYNFAGELGWDLDHYVDLILENINLDIDKKLDYLKNYDKCAKQDFDNAVKELNLNKEEGQLFRLVSDIGYYKWIREYEFVEAFYNYSFTLEALAKKLNLSVLEIMYLYTHEFSQDIDLKEIANKRIKNYFITSHRDGDLDEYHGQAAIKKFASLEFVGDEKIDQNISEINGMPARAGLAKGSVKIVDKVDDMKKMEEGDILVSQATSPDLMPAIKKASAIVTNEGGITCHAAIVSRELGIPCVVGTRIAAEVFKDGDMVNVDANQGIIKKL